MKLFSAVTAFLAWSGVAYSVPVKRDASSIVDSMDDIASTIGELRGSLANFDPGIVGIVTALKIRAQALQLARIITDAKRTAEESEPLDESGSAEVANVVTRLQPHVLGVLDDMIAKKEAFDKAILGVGSARILVKSDLQLLRKNTADFGEAVAAKLNPSTLSLLN